MAAGLCDVDPCGARLCVLADVRQALRDDVVDGHLNRLGQAPFDGNREMDRQGRPGGELLERDLEAVPADDGRMNSPCDGAELLEGRRHLPPGLIEPPAQVGVAGHLRLQQAQLERQCDESLLRAVVEVALQSLPLLLASLDDPGARASDLLQTRVQLGVEPRVLERDRGGGAHGIQQLRLVEQRGVVHERRDRLSLSVDHRGRSGVTWLRQLHRSSLQIGPALELREPVGKRQGRVAERPRERITQSRGGRLGA